MRLTAAQQDLDQCLLMINDWWWQAPMIARGIQSRDPADWPRPWDLLAQSGFCDLARTLGMLYTVMMTHRLPAHDVLLLKTNHHNLVQVCGGKYILNWSPGIVVNIQSPEITTATSIDSSVFEAAIR